MWDLWQTWEACTQQQVPVLGLRTRRTEVRAKYDGFAGMGSGSALSFLDESGEGHAQQVVIGTQSYSQPGVAGFCGRVAGEDVDENQLF